MSISHTIEKDYRLNLKLQSMMEIAVIESKLSTCEKLKVGGILTSNDFTIKSSGCNGAPSGYPHCKILNEPDNHSAIFEVHAENNLLSRCNWIPAQNESSYIFLTHLPCMSCAHIIVTNVNRLRIKKLYYNDVYIDNDSSYDKYRKPSSVVSFLKDSGIEVIKL